MLMAKKVADQALYQITGLMMAKGVFTIIFGIVALVWPGITLVSLAVITAIWLFLSGISGALTSVFMRDNYEYWPLRLLLSGVQIGVGAYLVQRPGISIATFVLLIGIAFIVEGVVEMVTSLTDKEEKASNRALSSIVGLLTISGGVIIWRYPEAGSLAFVWVLGLLALITGTMTLIAAIDLRNTAKA